MKCDYCETTAAVRAFVCELKYRGKVRFSDAVIRACPAHIKNIEYTVLRSATTDDINAKYPSHKDNMTRLNRDEIRALGDGRHQLHVRLSKHTKGTSPAVEWEGVTEVFVRLRDKVYRKHPVGEIIELAFERPWATFSESGISPDGICNAEEYLAELFNSE